MKLLFLDNIIVISFINYNVSARSNLVLCFEFHISKGSNAENVWDLINLLYGICYKSWLK